MENSNAGHHDPVDEILEAVWVLEENGEIPTAGKILSCNRDALIDEQYIGKVVENGLLNKVNEEYEFTGRGRERGESIIRRHRLAERLLADVLNIRGVSIDSNACRFEHFLSPEVTDHICIMLGHPKLCPHGKPIPPGPCCKAARRNVETAVVPLNELRAGESGRILYISTVHHHRLDRLTSMGLLPGRVVKVHQREPLFVVFLDETQLALEMEIVEEIFVLRS